MKEYTVKDESAEDVEEETINAYRTQRLENGSVCIKSGGTVVVAPSYPLALQRYANRILQRGSSIYDGWVPLYSFNSSGFTPEEILDEVVGQPLDRILEDIDCDD